MLSAASWLPFEASALGTELRFDHLSENQKLIYMTGTNTDKSVFSERVTFDRSSLRHTTVNHSQSYLKIIDEKYRHSFHFLKIIVIEKEIISFRALSLYKDLIIYRIIFFYFRELLSSFKIGESCVTRMLEVVMSGKRTSSRKDRLLAIFLVSEVYKRHASRGLFRDAWFTWWRQDSSFRFVTLLLSLCDSFLHKIIN